MNEEIQRLLSKPIKEQEEFLNAYMRQISIRNTRDRIAEDREELHSKEKSNQQRCKHPAISIVRDPFDNPISICRDCSKVI